MNPTEAERAAGDAIVATITGGPPVGGTDIPGEPSPPSGAALLDEVEAFLRRFVAFPSERCAVAVALWAAHTHMAPAFDSTPRLALLSPEKQSGKSRTLEILELLCAGAEFLSDASSAFIFRRIGHGRATILLDECDAIWKRATDDSAEALRSIVNAGHRRRATVGRVEMDGKAGKLMRFAVYAPVALAGIGDCLPDTILDRAVIVAMRRRAPDEHVRPYREREAGAEGEDLGSRLAEWAATVENKVGDPWPEMPEGVVDRPADVWEPLLMVADLAGGSWPTRARQACKAFVTGSKEDTVSAGVRLLADIRSAFGHDEQLGSKVLLERLHAMEESPWATMYGGHGLDQRGLAKKLKLYDIKSTKVRIGESTPRGYRRVDFADAWSRYLPAPSGTGVTSGTSQVNPVPDEKTAPEHGGTRPPPFRNSETEWNALTCDVPHVPAVPQGEGRSGDTEPGPTTGPCVTCKTLTLRYGPGGNPKCPACRTA